MQLRSDDKQEVRAAGSALKRKGRSAVPALMEALQHEDWRLREGAARVLGWIGSDAWEAVPALARALGDVDSVSVAAAQALGKIGPASEAAVPALVEATRDEHEMLRGSAVHALAAVGPEAAGKAVPVVVQALRDRSPYVRRLAARALGTLGRDRAETVPTLLKGLRDENLDVRQAAARSLGGLGPEASEAAGALVATLEEANARAEEAVGSRHGEAHRENTVLCAACARALGKIGAVTPEVALALVAALAYEDSRAPGSAEEALVTIGRLAVPALAEGLSSENLTMRIRAATVLGRIGPEAEGAIPALLEALTREEPRESRPRIGRTRWPTREAAARALGEIGTVAVPALVKALGDANPGVRLVAARTLSGMGRDAEPAIRALERALSDKSEYVRRAATVAISYIREWSREPKRQRGKR